MQSISEKTLKQLIKSSSILILTLIVAILLKNRHEVVSTVLGGLSVLLAGMNVMTLSKILKS